MQQATTMHGNGTKGAQQTLADWSFERVRVHGRPNTGSDSRHGTNGNAAGHGNVCGQTSMEHDGQAEMQKQQLISHGGVGSNMTDQSNNDQCRCSGRKTSHNSYWYR